MGGPALRSCYAMLRNRSAPSRSILWARASPRGSREPRKMKPRCIRRHSGPQANKRLIPRVFALTGHDRCRSCWHKRRSRRFRIMCGRQSGDKLFLEVWNYCFEGRMSLGETWKSSAAFSGVRMPLSSRMSRSLNCKNALSFCTQSFMYMTCPRFACSSA